MGATRSKSFLTSSPWSFLMYIRSSLSLCNSGSCTSLWPHTSLIFWEAALCPSSFSQHWCFRAWKRWLQISASLMEKKWLIEGGLSMGQRTLVLPTCCWMLDKRDVEDKTLLDSTVVWFDTGLLFFKSPLGKVKHQVLGNDNEMESIESCNKSWCFCIYK